MDDPQYGYRLLLMAAIIGVNAFFASAETALVSVRPSRLRTLAGKGNVGAQSALSLLAHPERLLSVVQVGVTLTSLALGWVGEGTLYALLLQTFDPVITPATRLLFTGISVVLAFTLMTFAHVVVGEVVPKNLAIEKADRLAVLVAPLLLVFYRFAEPFVWVIERSSARLSKLIGVQGSGHGGHSAEELKFIVAASQSSGHISNFEKAAISNLIELQYFAVREVMVPRNSLVMVEVEADIDDVLQVMSESGYSRLPVYDGDRENILGIVHVKDVLSFWTERRQSNLRRKPVAPFDLRRVVRKVPVVPETKALHEVMDELRARHAHVAFVVDEFGTIAGFLSMEDVMEQIFGEIEDEFDPMANPAKAAAALEGPLEVDGLTPIRDLDTQYQIELPDDLEVETLAGFLLHRLGRIPAEGDAVYHDGRRYTVTGMDHNRVARVRIEPIAPAEPAPEPEAQV
ncbi:MAG: hemolysin family protein [Bryobacteraceae bacterium]|nr:hemolysin family protein [Bryobacteraceae bacterium]